MTATFMCAPLVTLLLQKRERAGHVRGTDRRRRVEIGRADGRETIDAEEREADPDLLFEELEHPHEPGLAGGGEAAAREPPDADGVGAQRDPLPGDGASHEGAVDDNRRAAPHRRDDLREDVDGAPPVTELAPAGV